MRTLIVFSMLLFLPAAICENWPQWRGPLGTGISIEKGLPTEWSTKQNIAWRAELAGLGVSSPIVWGNQVFVTYQVGAGTLRQGRHPTFVQEGNPAEAGETPLGGARPQVPDEKISFAVAAFRTTDGRQLWEDKLDAAGKLPDVHDKRNLATSSSVTDGERVRDRSPLAAHGVDVRVADARVADLDEHVLRADITAFDGRGDEGLGG